MLSLTKNSGFAKAIFQINFKPAYQNCETKKTQLDLPWKRFCGHNLITMDLNSRRNIECTIMHLSCRKHATTDYGQIMQQLLISFDTLYLLCYVLLCFILLQPIITILFYESSLFDKKAMLVSFRVRCKMIHIVAYG